MVILLKLLGAKDATRAPGLTTRNKNATRNKGHRYLKVRPSSAQETHLESAQRGVLHEALQHPSEYPSIWSGVDPFVRKNKGGPKSFRPSLALSVVTSRFLRYE